MPLILDSPPPEPDLRERQRRGNHEADVIVVGAGVIGSALAITFARQGRSVILLEKSLKQPDRIVGELLQPGGVAALEKLGLRHCLDDIDAIRVEGYQVFYYDESVKIPYPRELASDTTSKRPEGRSFHHGRFIQQLRNTAFREPNISVIESTAVSPIRLDSSASMSGQVLGVTAKTNGQADYFFAPLTIVSDGYASTFRKDLHPHLPQSKSKFWALELKDCPLPSPLHGHVVLGDSAPVLLYQIGTHDTRVLVDIPTDTPTASVAAGGVKGHLRKVVLPNLPEQVQPSFDEALTRAENGESGSALKSMPNSWLPPSTKANSTPGLLLLGDALNMRHPLTGGGMTVALNDVVTLQTLLSPSALGPDNFNNISGISKAMRQFHWTRKTRGSTVINILAQALYSLFAADDTQLKTLQMGCFRYFQFGGNCIDGPVGLLAGIIQQPFVLFYHFFAVALLAMWIFIVEGSAGVKRRVVVSGDQKSEGQVKETKVDQDVKRSVWSPSNVVGIPLRFVASAAVFWKACVVIMPYIFSEIRT